MQLLKKSTVQLEAQNQRRKQIDEGIVIAQKVDALRQTLGNLQAQHAKFLEGMTAELEEQTQPLIKQIASLKREIIDLEDKRKELLQPLDEKWARVHVKQAELSEAESELGKNAYKVSAREKKAVELGTDLKNRLFKVKTRERELDKTIREASEELYIVEEKKREAERVRSDADEYATATDQILLSREAELAVREREMQMLKEHTDDRQKEMDLREARLIDREQTLDREIKRRK